MHIVLFQPEIPHNTGCIGRTCVATDSTLWLVRPLGFQLENRHLKRAGLDYWQHLDLRIVASWDELTQQLQTHFWFFSRWGSREYTSASFSDQDALVFGSESQGLPAHLTENRDRVLRIPTTGQVRSLNLATSVGVAIFEANRQIAVNSRQPKPSDLIVRYTNRIIVAAFTMATFTCTCSSYGEENDTVRFATFNVAMNRPNQGEMADELDSGISDQATRIAEIIQTVRPDVLLINELDYDVDHTAIKALIEKFLAVGQGSQSGIEFPHYFSAEVNTGVESGRDLNKDGKLGDAADRLGYGAFPGQYGMVVLSKFPLGDVRTFKNFLWKDMPAARLPHTDEPYYDEEDLAVLPLSSKSHWDVPVECPGGVVHFLVSHPTPPVFDGPEDRNGARNHDEIRFFADYVDPNHSNYIVDDAGKRGGLQPNDCFIIAGDLNADPLDGQSLDHAIRQLTAHTMIQADPIPSSAGGRQAANTQAGANADHQGDPSHDTGDFNDNSVGNLRIDYVLPSKNLHIHDNGIFWPRESEPGHALVGASDHRLVWIDVVMGPS